MIKLKDPVNKNDVHQQYKYHRNLSSPLLKKENIMMNNSLKISNNLKNIYKGLLSSLIAMK